MFKFPQNSYFQRTKSFYKENKVFFGRTFKIFFFWGWNLQNELIIQHMYMCWSCPLYLLRYAFFPVVFLYTSILHGIQAIVGRTQRGGRYWYNNPLFGSHSLGSCAKQHWKDLVRVGRWWRRWCVVHCHLWLASRFFMTELWSNVTERYKPKPSSPGKKSWRKGTSFPLRKKAYSFGFRWLHIYTRFFVLSLH